MYVIDSAAHSRLLSMACGDLSHETMIKSVREVVGACKPVIDILYWTTDDVAQKVRDWLESEIGEGETIPLPDWVTDDVRKQLEERTYDKVDGWDWGAGAEPCASINSGLWDAVYEVAREMRDEELIPKDVSFPEDKIEPQESARELVGAA